MYQWHFIPTIAPKQNAIPIAIKNATRTISPPHTFIKTMFAIVPNIITQNPIREVLSLLLLVNAISNIANSPSRTLIMIFITKLACISSPFSPFLLKKIFFECSYSLLPFLKKICLGNHSERVFDSLYTPSRTLSMLIG